MKNIIKIIVLVLSFFIMEANAQVAVGKETVDGAGILDFASGTTNGIILPIVETLPISAVNGTLLMDKTALKLKVMVNGSWVELSDEGSISGATFNTSDEEGSGIVIGSAESTTVDGVLVLEATDKALILPKVADPHLNIKSPYPGMICYDTTSQTLAVFDGLKWSYWK